MIAAVKRLPAFLAERYFQHILSKYEYIHKLQYSYFSTVIAHGVSCHLELRKLVDINVMAFQSSTVAISNPLNPLHLV